MRDDELRRCERRDAVRICPPLGPAIVASRKGPPKEGNRLAGRVGRRFARRIERGKLLSPTAYQRRNGGPVVGRSPRYGRISVDRSRPIGLRLAQFAKPHSGLVGRFGRGPVFQVLSEQFFV